MSRASYSPAIIDRVCELLQSGLSLRAVAKLDGMPNRATLWKWCQQYPEAAAAIARARELGWDELADRALENAETATDAVKGRLAFDAARWYLAKLNPERYGERQRIQSELSGPGGRPVQVHSLVGHLSDEDVSHRLQTILQDAEARRLAAINYAGEDVDQQDEFNGEDLA